MGIPPAKRVVHRPKPPRRRGAARAIPEAPTGEPGVETSLAEHPDGWYWLAPDGRQQFGPFETYEGARADRGRGSEQALDEPEALDQAEEALRSSESVEAVHESPYQPLGSTSEEER